MQEKEKNLFLFYKIFIKIYTIGLFMYVCIENFYIFFLRDSNINEID